MSIDSFTVAVAANHPHREKIQALNKKIAAYQCAITIFSRNPNNVNIIHGTQLLLDKAEYKRAKLLTVACSILS